VEHIIGYRRVRITVEGEARHAGTTPMRRRKDALAAAAEMISAIESAARDMGEPAVATCGNVVAGPGLYNVVPGLAQLSVEMRHVEAAKVAALYDTVIERCREIAARRGVVLDTNTIAGLEPAAMSGALVQEAERVARDLGVAHRRMVSGAGHDAMLFAAAGIPAVMFFVPSRDGISHSPEEHTEPADLWAGYAFLRDFAARLTRVPETV
jgi:allantoate deiminase